MIEKEIGNRCTGCSACYNACPQKCITMKENQEGFLYPDIDSEKCKKCKVCINKCPVLKDSIQEKEMEIVCAAYSKDENNRLKSSSGGCFGEFAKYILKEQGIIFGAGYDEEFNVIHKSISKITNLEKLQGSKYVQSKIGNTFKEVKVFLEEGKQVLFSGTPCQVSGLKSFLEKEYENLYTIDIVCHGVPSQKILNKYLEEDKKDSNIQDIQFRDKTNGWKQYSIKVSFDNKDSQIIPAKEDTFMKVFLSNVCLRESCYNCKFKESNSKADITIGDFWGISNIKPELDDNKGISILFIHSKKGQIMFNSCKDNLVIEHGINKSELIKYNPCIETSVKRPQERDNFFEQFNQLNFEELVEKSIPKQSLIKRIIKKSLHILKIR